MDFNVKPDDYYNVPRSEMLPFVPLDARKILEVGCGSGCFGDVLKIQRNAEVWGVEYNETIAKEAEKKLDKVIVGDIESGNMLLPGNFFDCIVFNDVLEHLKDPWTVLKNLRSVLVDKGCIVVSVPNIRFWPVIGDLLFYKEWKYVDRGVLDKTHLRFFTEKTLYRLFEDSGYAIIKIQGINLIPTLKFRILNLLSFRLFEDMGYLQFACVVKKIQP